jgi:hypothetical protein
MWAIAQWRLYPTLVFFALRECAIGVTATYGAAIGVRLRSGLPLAGFGQDHVFIDI